jgi:hypothetical protein
LQLLESDGMITQSKGRQNGTTIKISNYGLYQLNNTLEYATDSTTGGTTDNTADGQRAAQQAVHKQEVYKNDKAFKNERSVSKPPRAAGTHKFIPPTLDEVIAYCQERRNGIDAERFIDFYASKGWMVGSNKMKDWKAAVRNWEKRNNSKGGSTTYENDDSSGHGAGFKPKEITQADMLGFHNALDRYKDIE